MRYNELCHQLREARHQKGWSQASLAVRSGVSRVTIARAEAGSTQDLRMGTLLRLCEALDLHLVARPGEAPPASEAVLARERERGRRLERRGRHAALAARLLALPRSEALGLLRRARQIVDRWEREGLCSTHYVVRWRALLTGPRERVARSLLDPGEWADALFQNSPWTFALELEAA